MFVGTRIPILVLCFVVTAALLQEPAFSAPPNLRLKTSNLAAPRHRNHAQWLIASRFVETGALVPTQRNDVCMYGVENECPALHKAYKECGSDENCCEALVGLLECAVPYLAQMYCEPEEIAQLAASLGVDLANKCKSIANLPNIKPEACDSLSTGNCDRELDIFPACLDPTAEECCDKIEEWRPCAKYSVGSIVCDNDPTGILSSLVINELTTQLEDLPKCSVLQGYVEDTCPIAVLGPCSEEIQSFAEAAMDRPGNICDNKDSLLGCIREGVRKEDDCDGYDGDILNDIRGVLDQACGSASNITALDNFLNPSPTLAPVPSSSPAPVDAACFPGSSKITLASGKSVTMDQLKIGDRVLSSPGRFSEIFFFSHSLPSGSHAFIQLTTRTTTISISPDHYLRVQEGLVSARDISLGSELLLDDGSTATVIHKESRYLQGLYNPHTLTGDIVVDGVMASCFTRNIHPYIASLLLTPIKALYYAGYPLSSLPDVVASNWAALAPPSSSITNV